MKCKKKILSRGNSYTVVLYQKTNKIPIYKVLTYCYLYARLVNEGLWIDEVLFEMIIFLGQ